jgi:hypothetical protein
MHALTKGAHVQQYLLAAVRLPKFTAALANEHKRHPAAVIPLHMVERTADTVEERRKEKIVGDYGGIACGRVFFRHQSAFRGLCDRAAGFSSFQGLEAGRPLLFPRAVNTCLLL